MNKSIKIGFIVAVTAQAIILLGVPARTMITLSTGREVILSTDSRDPFNPFSGNMLSLSYAVARPDSLEGFDRLKDGDVVFVTIAPNDSGVWEATELSAEKPSSTDQVFLRGRMDTDHLRFGVETWYVPEERIGEISERLYGPESDVKVVVAVDNYGRSALKHLLMDGVKYDF